MVFEGGASRTAFSCGVMDAFLEEELMPDYFIGVSAGIAFGVSYLSKQKGRNLKLLEEYGTPTRVKGHCRAVADTACRIGRALNRHGHHFDLELVNAAGLLHDIARVKEHHWDVGADFAEKLGYVQEAAIIRVHMTYSPFHPITQATETDLVCLADRLVKEDRYVGIDERVQYIIDKAVRNGHPEAEPRILEKKEELKEFVHEIEVEIHMTVDELMKYGYAE